MKTKFCNELPQVDLLEGELNISYLPVNKPGEYSIDADFEKWIQIALKAFGYELYGSKMKENGIRSLSFDMMCRKANP